MIELLLLNCTIFDKLVLEPCHTECRKTGKSSTYLKTGKIVEPSIYRRCRGFRHLQLYHKVTFPCTSASETLSALPSAPTTAVKFSTGLPVISSDNCAGIEILTDCKTIIVSVHYNATFVNKGTAMSWSDAAQVYRQRNPRDSPLWQLLDEYFDEFEECYDNLLSKEYGFYRPVASHIVRKYLECGDLHQGFARVRCPDCHQEYLLSFSCGGRYFCPSCHAKKTVQFAAHLIIGVRRKLFYPICCPFAPRTQGHPFEFKNCT